MVLNFTLVAFSDFQVLLFVKVAVMFLKTQYSFHYKLVTLFKIVCGNAVCY